MRVVTLTVIALLAFAANSVLARLALGTPGADPWAYTGIRLASGALTLLVLVAFTRRGNILPIGGTWRGTATLFGYALAFSIAYLALAAGTGALILFASVQFGLLGFAISKGDRPGLFEWLGIGIAFGGLVYLVSPGLVAPDPLGALLMVAAGLCWTGYTLAGRSSSAPLVDTAGNFTRGLPLALPLIAFGVSQHGLDPLLFGYAVASGALASGVGYAIWYLVLPALSRTRVAFVQLTVPAIAAGGGVIFLAEPLSARLIIASLAILGGVAISLAASSRRKPS